MKLTLSFLILVFALLVNINTKAYSQTPPCFPEYQGLAYQMDDIVNCPPYNTNMPLNVFIGYLALDSLSKYAPLKDYESFLDRQTYNDTLRTMMKYIYQSVDYHPDNFFCFMLHDRYPSTPVNEYFYDFINKVLIESPDPILDASLIGSFLIAQINVDSVYCYIDTIAKWAQTSRTVRASINNVFKGASAISFNNPLIIEPQFQFTYAKEWFMGRYIDRDTTIFELEKNKSYIVFFEYRFVCRDSSNVYYTIYPIRCSKSKTACMYPIVNGNIIDINNELGFGTNVNLNVFNTMLNNRISFIKNYTP